jgi:hypothetical protein
MKIICPNKSDPAWKNLVAAIGEPQAFLAFFRNGDSIPDTATAWKLLWPNKGAAKIAKLPYYAPKPGARVSMTRPKPSMPKIAAQFPAMSKTERENLEVVLGQILFRSETFQHPLAADYIK